jgi:hypothetical protein
MRPRSYIDTAINTGIDFLFGYPQEREFKYIDKRLGKLTGEEEPVAHLRTFPQQPGEINVTYDLSFTPNNGQPARRIHVSPSEFTDHWDDHGKLIGKCDKLTVLMDGMGFGSKAEKRTMGKLRAKLMEKFPKECVLRVHWDNFPRESPIDKLSHNFIQRAVNTITVGRLTAVLLFQYISCKFTKAEQIHVLGSGLGAQSGHFAAQYLHVLLRDRLYNGSDVPVPKINRLTGLDPIAHDFRGYPGAHIQKGDAAFVDVIHTSSALRLYLNHHKRRKRQILTQIYPATIPDRIEDLIISSEGDGDALGDVDFYPNRGTAKNQPKCKCGDIFQTALCSHPLAITYYMDSLDRNMSLFRSTECLYRKLPDGLLNPVIYYTTADYPCWGGAAVKGNDPLFINYMGAHADRNGAKGKLFLDYETDHVMTCDADADPTDVFELIDAFDVGK